jgi:S1-C subfamily serine protease
VVVVSVVEGSEAERSGLTSGDVLLEVDGAAVATMDDARARLSGALSDDVLVRIRRGTDTLLLRVGRDTVRR